MLNKIMNNLECRKQGFNKVICKRTGKEIKLSECINCPYKEYKMHKKSENIVVSNTKKHNKTQKTVQISLQASAKLQSNVDTLQKNSRKSTLKRKTYKLAKMERERFSLFTDDDSKCMLCGSKYQLTWNEIFRGKNRQLSMKYGLVQRLCLSCHMKYQDDPVFNEIWHKKGQIAFNKHYPGLDFVKIFGRNYLK